MLYFQIMSVEDAVYKIANLPDAIEKLCKTSLRKVAGNMTLDQCLTSRDKINSELLTIMDEATDKWGVKVNRVELKDITPPHDIQQGMEIQIRAERDRRATILEAEGEKRSAILEAEGVRESQIKRAEGQKQSAILNAEGEAEAIQLKANATADAIKKVAESLNLSGGRDAANLDVAKLYVEEFGKLAKESNTMIIPSDVNNVASMIATAMSVIDKTKKLLILILY